MIVRTDLAKTYFIADTHFDHANIIRYCNRPFASVQEMNQTLLESWNAIVTPIDTVFFLGDLALHNRGYWWRQLNGIKHSIRGNHDRYGSGPIVIHLDGSPFLLAHDPADIPTSWTDWAIHGHKHDTVPFVDPTEKRICVSVELIGYRPISSQEILSAANPRAVCA